jgi:hypothetical protein
VGCPDNEKVVVVADEYSEIWSPEATADSENVLLCRLEYLLTLSVAACAVMANDPGSAGDGTSPPERLVASTAVSENDAVPVVECRETKSLDCADDNENVPACESEYFSVLSVAACGDSENVP